MLTHKDYYYREKVLKGKGVEMLLIGICLKATVSVHKMCMTSAYVFDQPHIGLIFI